jgi:hypothetical protein
MTVAVDMMLGAVGMMTDAVLHAVGVPVAEEEGGDEDSTMTGIVGTLMEGIEIEIVNTVMIITVVGEAVGTMSALIIEAMVTVQVLEDSVTTLPPLVPPTISQLLRCVCFPRLQNSGADLHTSIACR